MPIYEYECRRCEHRFELIQKFSDKPRKRCPECAGAVDRLISPPAIRFKGSGWYVTDYADKKAPKDAEGSDAGAAKAGDTKDEAKKADSEASGAKKTGAKKEKKAS